MKLLSWLGALTPANAESVSTAGQVDRAAAILSLSAATLFIYFDAFGGVIRYLFPMMGLTFFAYLPSAVAILAIVAHLIVRLGDKEAAVSTIFVLAFAALEIVISILLGRNIAEVAFCIYIWLPFFIGIIISQRRQQDVLSERMIPIFVVAVVGVLLNTITKFPWTDANYEVLGRQMVASRDWVAYGMERLAGFTRASYTAASQILICLVAVNYVIKNIYLKSASYLLAVLAIYYTTSKSQLGVVLILPAIYLFIGKFKDAGESGRKWLAISILSILLAIVFLGPLLAMSYGPALYPNGVGTGANYSSLADRVLNTWPNAIAMIDPFNISQWLIGRGLGSIGSPQDLFHPELINPADNLAIYLFVTFGTVSVVFVYFLFRGGIRALAGGERGRRDFLFAVAMLGIGATANVIESIFPALIFGLVCGRLPSRRVRRASSPAVTSESSRAAEGEGRKRRRRRRDSSGALV